MSPPASARGSQYGTPAQVAREVHTTEQSLAQQRHKGTGLPYIKLGRKVLYRWSDVDQYMAANTRDHAAS